MSIRFGVGYKTKDRDWNDPVEWVGTRNRIEEMKPGALRYPSQGEKKWKSSQCHYCGKLYYRYV